MPAPSRRSSPSDMMTEVLMALLAVLDALSDGLDLLLAWTLNLLGIQQSFPPSVPRRTYSRARPTVLVTGTSTGIGKAVALRLAGLGYAVLAGVRRVEDGKRLEEEFLSMKGHHGTIAVPGGSLRALIVDVAKADSLEACRREVDRILAETGATLYAVVANAGVPQFGAFESTPPSDVRAAFDVNCFGALETARIFLPHLRRYGPGARVLFVSSISAITPPPLMHAYAGSKCGLEGAVDALRMELALEKIAVVLVEPGVISTPIWEKGRNGVKEVDKPSSSSTPISRVHRLINGASSAIPAAPGFATSDYVARRVAAALGTRFPGARWPVGFDAWSLRVARWLLPTRVWDAGLYVGLRVVGAVEEHWGAEPTGNGKP